ncbi:MAG: nuclear transport factor 2 family protein [Chloroflexota bacterium]|nr:nuclear transport factor 2 family protein [Chloroflexota bacterium]
MAFDPHKFFIKFVRAIDELDFATLEPMIHPDVVGDMPQSGERSHGFAGFRAQLEQYPSGGIRNPVALDARLVADGDRWAITPAYTVVPLARNNEFTVLMRAQYPDGRWWHVITLVELRDERIYRTVNYFAPEMPAPLA